MTILWVILGVAALVAVMFAAFKSLSGIQSQLTQSVHQNTQQVNQQLAQLQSQFASELQKINSQVQQTLSSNATLLQKTHDSVGQRLEGVSKVVTEVTGRLAQLGEQSQRILEVGKDLTNLQDLLKPPKLRGELGEYFLEQLLSQILPPDSFSLQYGFRSGEKVDAIIRFGGRMVSVDSKFPLENIQKAQSAVSDEERKGYHKKFQDDVKRHIDRIASKYILPEEGTLDFAFMYIPAENVYYEVIIKQGSDANLSAYAQKHRVMPVSPNSFYAYLCTVVLGLRGMQVEKDARAILERLTQLRGDMERFAIEFDKVGTHLKNAQNSFALSEKRLSKLAERLQIADQQTDVPVALLQSTESL